MTYKVYTYPFQATMLHPYKMSYNMAAVRSAHCLDWSEAQLDTKVPTAKISGIMYKLNLFYQI